MSKAEAFDPDWQLNDIEQLQVLLSIALHNNVPDWPGCTDKQMEKVALYVYNGMLEERAKRK